MNKYYIVIFISYFGRNLSMKKIELNKFQCVFIQSYFPVMPRPNFRNEFIKKSIVEIFFFFFVLIIIYNIKINNIVSFYHSSDFINCAPCATWRQLMEKSNPFH